LAAVLNEGRAAQLWSEFRIRYLLVEAPTPAIKATPGIRTVWSDGQIWLFDLSGTSLSEGSFGG
jgi:hypothetical protein